MAAALDPLTWLPNRELFEARLARGIAAPRAPRHGFALLHIDLDRFGTLDRMLGPPYGDRVLREAAVRIAQTLRLGTDLGRLGGDQFAAWIADAGEPATAARAARRTLERLREPYVVECVAVRLTASIGISLYPAHATEPAALLRLAERALYQAKLRGRDGYFPF